MAGGDSDTEHGAGMSTQPPPENHWHRDEAAGLGGNGTERRKGTCRDDHGNYRAIIFGLPVWACDRRKAAPEPPNRAWTDHTDRRQRSEPREMEITDEMVAAGQAAFNKFMSDHGNQRWVAPPVTTIFRAMFAAAADRRTHTRRICNRQGGAKFG